MVFSYIGNERVTELDYYLTVIERKLKVNTIFEYKGKKYRIKTIRPTNVNNKYTIYYIYAFEIIVYSSANFRVIKY